MAYREISLSGNISRVSVSGSLNADTGMSGTLNMAERVYENDYEKLKNKPSINGVELVQASEMHAITNTEITDIVNQVWS